MPLKEIDTAKLLRDMFVKAEREFLEKNARFAEARDGVKTMEDFKWLCAFAEELLKHDAAHPAAKQFRAGSTNQLPKRD